MSSGFSSGVSGAGPESPTPWNMCTSDSGESWLGPMSPPIPSPISTHGGWLCNLTTPTEMLEETEETDSPGNGYFDFTWDLTTSDSEVDSYSAFNNEYASGQPKHINYRGMIAVHVARETGDLSGASSSTCIVDKHPCSCENSSFEDSSEMSSPIPGLIDALLGRDLEFGAMANQNCSSEAEATGDEEYEVIGTPPHHYADWMPSVWEDPDNIPRGYSPAGLNVLERNTTFLGSLIKEYPSSSENETVLKSPDNMTSL